MYSKITLKNIRLFFSKTIAFILVLVSLGYSSYSQVQLNEGFNTMVPLPTGWAQQNLSTPAGAGVWSQGNPAAFPAFSGPTNSYAGCSFASVTGDNTISNWLFTPTVTIANGNIFTFYARTNGAYPDRLQLRMSTNAASVNAGATNSSVGDFTNLLVDINPTLTASGFPAVWTKYTATISGVPTPTTGRFAFRYFVTNGGPNGANSDFIGVDEVLYSTACTGTPVPGNTISSVPSVCAGVTFNLSLQNAIGTATYQWQSGPTATGPWTNIPGATSSTLSTFETASTYYQNVVTCTPSGLSAASTPLLVPLAPASQCYCQPPTSNCTLGDIITKVVLGTINNTSACGANGFTNYSIGATATQTTNLEAGSVNPMSVTVGNGGTEFVGVWIDYNQNVIYEANEFTLLGFGNGVTITNNITVPVTALPGLTRMRVRVRWNTTLTGANACLGYTYGETEDYSVTITPCVPINITVVPASVTISCGSKATFTQTATGTNLSYQWQQRVNATAPWTTVTNGAGIFSGATTNSLVIDNTPVTFNGYQYRLIYSGPCTPTNFSSAVTLTVNPLITVVTPASPTICAGTIQKLTIGNISTPAPNTSTFTSGTLNAVIPDANPAGYKNIINVTTIPAGSIVTGISVRLNIVHPNPGFEIVGVLKAPNNAILNLAYAATGTQKLGANFINTVFSSTGTNTLGAGTAPWTGTFRADAQMTALAPFAPTGPTGFEATTPNFSDLFSGGGNGAWTFAVYDFGSDPASTGTVTNWSITIDYLSGAPATGVWGPITTTPTIFTDAAATIPYTGTSLNAVWVKPTATTTYTVDINAGTCTGIASVLVTVNNPITGTSTTTNKAVCVGGNTSFTATAPLSGNTILHQWKVSTDAGVTFTNVANAGVYSGATTATLNITGAMLSMNGYRYKDSLYVNVCNSFVNTNVATLTVNPNPVITISANPLTALYPGQTTTLTAAVSPNAAATYTWFRNGVAVPGATASTLVLDVDDLGVYTVNVTDVNGCSGSSASIEIKDAPNDILFIYPSPNTGQFQIRYYSLPGNSTLPRMVNVYDSKGARVFTKSYSVVSPYTRLDVDMSHYNSGIYMVELSDANGRRLKTGRVLIQ